VSGRKEAGILVRLLPAMGRCPSWLKNFDEVRILNVCRRHGSNAHKDFMEVSLTDAVRLGNNNGL
jgi:hypothetical protein